MTYFRIAGEDCVNFTYINLINKRECYTLIMRKSPTIDEIKKWLVDNNPLNLFEGHDDFTLSDIDPNLWSGHFNYLVIVKNKKFVLRFKGPEWGDASGIINGYNMLKAVEEYEVGPKVCYLTENFFGEPMMFEEYLDGKLLTEFPLEERVDIFPEVIKLIVTINSIKLPEELSQKQERLFDYARHKKSWHERLHTILENTQTYDWGMQIQELLPRAEKMLDDSESLLQQTLKQNGPAFVFMSAHVGHCIKTESGVRFLNWEKNGFGDPSYTLAVFLASIITYDDFQNIKKSLINIYLESNPIPDFRELVEQRIREREVSNLLWLLNQFIDKKKAHLVKELPKVQERFDRIKLFL